MAQVTGYTAARMKAIEDGTVVDGRIDPVTKHLILKRFDGTEIDAGLAKGEDATALLGVTSSADLSMTLGGAGTPAAPWDLKVDHKAPRYMQLAPGYVGPGPAKVTKVDDPAGTQYGPLEWLGTYNPTGNPMVRVQELGGVTYIMGHADGHSIGCWRPIPLNTNFYSYFDRETNNVAWEPLEFGYFGAVRTTSGIIKLGGLIATGVVGSNQIIGTLPPDMRPDFTLVFICQQNTGGANVNIRVYPNGDVQIYGNTAVVGSYVSLDNVIFPAAGVATWSPLGVTGVSPGVYGEPSYWTDKYGVTWFLGIPSISATTQNTLIFNLPVGLQSNILQQHIPTASGNGYGCYRWTRSTAAGAPVTSLQIATGAQGTWISLGGLTLQNNVTWTLPEWHDPYMLLNSWTDYGGSNANGAYWKRADGLVFYRGLLKGGSYGGEAFNLTNRVTPKGARMFACATSGGLGRADMKGPQTGVNAMRALTPQGGPASITWFSVDGIIDYAGSI